jgi:ClpP class serine protease
MMSPARCLEPSERASMERLMEAIYQQFVQAVAEGRHTQASEIEPLAQGRVWIGSDAQNRGLVDTLGGFETALSEARKRIGPGAERLEPELLDTRGMPSLSSLLRGFVANATQSHNVGVAGDLIMLSTTSERVWMWSPWGELRS